MNTPSEPLLNFLNDQELASQSFTPRQWELLVREGRAANLLSRIAVLLRSGGDRKGLPEKIQLQLDNAYRIAISSARSVRWEVKQIAGVLGPANIPFILLKGAAYEMAGLPPARGRLFVDVDIMVARKDIAQAEKKLIQGGWMATKLNAYDQKYYRQWMHEIPPLRNVKRGTSLDVHHTIIPPTACFKPDVDKLWASAVEVSEQPGVYVLGPEDMILHSATHLFHDGDLAGGLRDLVDLDELIRFFSKDAGFMGRLITRAQEMDLLRPLYYLFRYSRHYLNTPVPAKAVLKVEALSAPIFPVPYIMDALVVRAFHPEVRPSQSRLTLLSQWLLYMRSHYLRMPLYLLLPHLVRKALVSEEG